MAEVRIDEQDKDIQPYLERVEAAGMEALVQSIEDNNKARAMWVLYLLQELSIV